MLIVSEDFTIVVGRQYIKFIDLLKGNYSFINYKFSSIIYWFRKSPLN